MTMPYNIFYNRQSRKTLLKMPTEIAKSIREKLDEISVDPHRKRDDVKPLKRRPGFRLRIGAWRVNCKLESQKLEILVINIASRGDVYK